METNNFVSDLAIHPGEFLLETLEDLDMSQSDLANRLGRPHQAVNEIIKGKKSITSATALALEDVLGVPAHIWTGLEAEYQMVLARQAERQQLEEESQLLPLFPFAELVKLGLVNTCSKAVDKVDALKNFFGVAKLSQLGHVKDFQPAFRITNHNHVSHEAVAAWLEAARKLADKVEAEPFNKAKLTDHLSQLRALVFLPFNEALIQADVLLKKCGVALVLIPHFKKTKVQGATFWLSDRKAVIAMTTRGAYADIFWFSFFHEVGHILLHGQRKVFLEDGVTDPALLAQEQEANDFSQKLLIPTDLYQEFVAQGNFSAAAILDFAKTIKITPDIFIGRLKHGRLLPPFLFNEYKRKITF